MVPFLISIIAGFCFTGIFSYDNEDTCLLANSDLPNGNIMTIKGVSSVFNCIEECQDLPECFGVVWVSASESCQLKTAFHDSLTHDTWIAAEDGGAGVAVMMDCLKAAQLALQSLDDERRMEQEAMEGATEANDDSDNLTEVLYDSDKVSEAIDKDPTITTDGSQNLDSDGSTEVMDVSGELSTEDIDTFGTENMDYNEPTETIDDSDHLRESLDESDHTTEELDPNGPTEFVDETTESMDHSEHSEESESSTEDMDGDGATEGIDVTESIDYVVESNESIDSENPTEVIDDSEDTTEDNDVTEAATEPKDITEDFDASENTTEGTDSDKPTEQIDDLVNVTEVVDDSENGSESIDFNGATESFDGSETMTEFKDFDSISQSMNDSERATESIDDSENVTEEIDSDEPMKAEGDKETSTESVDESENGSEGLDMIAPTKKDDLDNLTEGMESYGSTEGFDNADIIFETNNEFDAGNDEAIDEKSGLTSDQVISMVKQWTQETLQNAMSAISQRLRTNPDTDDIVPNLPPKHEKCTDEAENCDATFCTVDVIANMCKQTCGICPSNIECQNMFSDTYCFFSAKMGYCGDESIGTNCKESCGTCVCSDWDAEFCSAYGRNHCWNGGVKKMCKKSCSMC